MIYNNLLYFLTAIFLFSMATVPETATLPPIPTLLVFLVVIAAFDRYAKIVFRRMDTNESAGYFKAEKRIAITALLVFGIVVFALDLKYYFAFLSMGDRLPSLVNIGGFTVFLLLFVLLWRRARPSYEQVFAKKYRSSIFILSNIKANLPIVLPWIVLTLCYDFIGFVQWPRLQQVMASAWGDIVFFGMFLFFIFLFFPPLVRKLWGCKKIGEGPLRDHLIAFCKKQNFSAELYIWPLFEGRVITAGVMGVIPGLRYLLITPALLETMSTEELDSVMAHEIGHAKRFHLPLYVVLIGGFIVAAGFLAEPFYYYFFSKDIFYTFVDVTGLSPELVRNIVIAVPALLFLLIYFRFVFGYFMRNFERQADLHVFPVLGDSRAIISAFEKIAILSGNIREQPSWHHFGIGERVDFLKKCEKEPARIALHHGKVGVSLLLYVAFLSAALFFVRNASFEDAISDYEDKYIRADLLYNARQEENPAHWLFFAGNFFLEHTFERRAVIAYEMALKMEPRQPDILNNYSWLLLTAADAGLRDPQKALEYARSAAEMKPSGIILDTLATAWWANGYPDEAIKTEMRALSADPDKAEYYQSQIEKFKSRAYSEEPGKKVTGELLGGSDSRKESS